MTEFENTREIERFFQMALAAADNSIAGEVKLNENKLFGRVRMKELQNSVTPHCW